MLHYSMPGLCCLTLKTMVFVLAGSYLQISLLILGLVFRLLKGIIIQSRLTHWWVQPHYYGETLLGSPLNTVCIEKSLSTLVETQTAIFLRILVIIWLPQKLFFLWEFFFAWTPGVLPCRYIYILVFIQSLKGSPMQIFLTLSMHNSLLSHSWCTNSCHFRLTILKSVGFCLCSLSCFTVQKLPEGKKIQSNCRADLISTPPFPQG